MTHFFFSFVKKLKVQIITKKSNKFLICWNENWKIIHDRFIKTPFGILFWFENVNHSKYFHKIISTDGVMHRMRK